MLDDFHGTPSGSAMRIRLSEGRQIANQAIDRFAQALHRKLDIIGLEMTPAPNFCEVTVFREPLEIFRGDLFSRDALPGELLADERVSGHCAVTDCGGG